jgi:L-fuconate dehydratase
VQLRWLGPKKGVLHMATGALVNAVWDLWAKQAGRPLWQLLAEMPTGELVAAVDFHHIRDALTPTRSGTSTRRSPTWRF